MEQLALALLSLVANFVVKQLVSGQSPGRDEWGGIAGQIAAVLVRGTAPESGALARIERTIGQLPAREFDQHMAAGRRFLRDLPAGWRTAGDRRDIIRDARGEFVRAAGIAETMGDRRRQAFAEVAIAGCWLWVPSLPDAQQTLRDALNLVGLELLTLDAERWRDRALIERLNEPDLPLFVGRSGAIDNAIARDRNTLFATRTALLGEYAAVIKLATAYRAVADSSLPIDPARVPHLWSDLAFAAPPGRTVNRLGLEVTVTALRLNTIHRPQVLGAFSAPGSIDVDVSVRNPGFRAIGLAVHALELLPVPQLASALSMPPRTPGTAPGGIVPIRDQVRAILESRQVLPTGRPAKLLNASGAEVTVGRGKTVTGTLRVHYRAKPRRVAIVARLPQFQGESRRFNPRIAFLVPVPA